jgi:uridine kinase
MSARRRRLLADVAARVPAPGGDDCVRVAIDGVDGSGKTVFADQLAGVLQAGGRPTIRVSADDFHQVRAVRHRLGRDSPEGFWLDSYDYERLRANVLAPLGPGGSRRYRPAAHELRTDALLDLPWLDAAPGSVLVLDGLFLHRDELASEWDLSVFLEVPFAASVARMARRDGSEPDPDHPSVRRYVAGQRLYFDACAPWHRADLVVDNTSLDEPRLVPRP